MKSLDKKKSKSQTEGKKERCPNCNFITKKFGRRLEYDPLELMPSFGYVCMNKNCREYHKIYISNIDL